MLADVLRACLSFYSPAPLPPFAPAVVSCRFLSFQMAIISKYADFVSIILIAPLSWFFRRHIYDRSILSAWLPRTICCCYFSFRKSYWHPNYDIFILIFGEKCCWSITQMLFLWASGRKFVLNVDCTKCEKWIFVTLPCQLRIYAQEQTIVSRKRMKEKRKKQKANVNLCIVGVQTKEKI